MAAKTDHFYTLGSEVLSGFEIVARIGRGQFGEVWKVRERENDREFAAKVINLEENESGLKEIRALRLVAKLNHLHLVRIQTFQVRQLNGELVPFKELEQFLKTQRKKLRELVIVMELGDRALSERLRDHQEDTGTDGGLPVSELQRYLLGAARGIDYLYANNQIVHCDIKPANLLIFGQDVKVADCGVAVSVSTGGTQTVSMSPFYSPPELNRNRPGQWTDQYSLAISYYELRTGRLPFDRRLGPFDVMRVHDEGKLSFDSPALKPGEREVLRYASAMRAEDRYPTCEAFAEQIDRAIKNLPIKRPDECGPAPVVVVKLTASEVSSKPTRKPNDQAQSGAITFTQTRPPRDEVRTDEIDKLVEDSLSGETIRPPQALIDTDGQVVALTPTGDSPSSSSDWAGSTITPDGPMGHLVKPSSKPVIRLPAPDTDWGSGSKTKPRSKKPSPMIPAIAVTVAMLGAIGGVGFVVWKSGKPKNSEVANVGDDKIVKPVEKTGGDAVKSTIASRLKFDDLFNQLGNNAETLTADRIRKVLTWVTDQKDVNADDLTAATKLLDALGARLATHQQKCLKYSTEPVTFDGVTKLSELRRQFPAAPTDSWVQTVAEDRKAWAQQWEQSFFDRERTTLVAAYQTCCKSYESEIKTSVADRIQYIDWLTKNRNAEHVKTADPVDRRIATMLKNLIAAGDREQNHLTVLDFFFDGDKARPNRLELLDAADQKALATWDAESAKAKVTTALKTVDRNLTSIDDADLKAYAEKRTKAISDATMLFKTRHPKHVGLIDEKSIAPESPVVVLAKELKTNPKEMLPSLRSDLTTTKYDGSPALGASFAKVYMALAAAHDEEISHQRRVREKFPATNERFQRNLAAVIMNRLQAAGEPDFFGIKDLAGTDEALGWTAAAEAEAKLHRGEMATIPADRTIDGDESKALPAYLAYLRALSDLRSVATAKNPNVKTRIERTQDLVNKFSVWLVPESAFATTGDRKRLVAEEIMRTIIAVPQPSAKPLEDFGKNPFKVLSGDEISVLIGLAENAEKLGRKMSPSEYAHLALLDKADLEIHESKKPDAFQAHLAKGQFPETPNGSVHPQTGLAYFKLRQDENKPDAAIPMVRYWLADGDHFAGASTDKDRQERATIRWKQVALLLEKWPADDRPIAKALRSHYQSMVLMNRDETSETFAKAIAGLNEGESELPPGERAISLGWRSYAAILDFTVKPMAEALDSETRRAKWDRLFRDAEESIRLAPNPRAHFVLAYRHFAEADSRGDSNLYAPREVRGIPESQRNAIDRSMRHFEAACRCLGQEPNSSFWLTRASYGFFWGLQLGKYGGRTDEVRALLNDAKTSIEQAIRQSSPRDPVDLKTKASILEDLAWLVGDNREANYELALRTIDEALKLLKADSPDRAKYWTESIRILRRAISQRAINRNEFLRRVREIDREMKDQPSFSVPYRLQRAVVKGYEGDETVAEAELLDLATTKLDESTLPASLLLAERWYSQSRAGRSPNVDKVKKLAAALAEVKSMPPSLTYQTAYLRGLLETLLGRSADAREQLMNSADEIQRLLNDGKMIMEWPFSIRSVVAGLETGIGDDSATRRARSVSLLRDLQKRYPNHILDDDADRIRKFISNP